MLKKIILASAIVTSASFATWDKFPVVDAGHGQAHVGFNYNIQGDYSSEVAYIGARYGVIEKLELGLNLPYQINSDYDGEDGADGLGNLSFLVKYQFLPFLNAFLDVDFPIGDDEVADDGFGFHFGAQYSNTFGPVVLGSELGFALATEGDDKISPAKEINVGAELDFPLGFVTPYVGADVNAKVTDTDYDGVDGGDSGDTGLGIYAGADFAFSQTLDLDVSVWFGVGEDYYGEDTPVTIDAHLNVNF